MHTESLWRDQDLFFPKRKSNVLQLYVPLNILNQTNKTNLKTPPYITGSWWIDFWRYRVELASQYYWKSMSTEGQTLVQVFPPNCTWLPLPEFFFLFLKHSISNMGFFFPQDILFLFSRLESHLIFYSDILFH